MENKCCPPAAVPTELSERLLQKVSIFITPTSSNPSTLIPKLWKYYPVNIGEIFNNRYQAIAKIGYGVSSTVWLGLDLIDSKYVVLKMYTNGADKNHEVEIYERINATKSKHLGKTYIRQLFDHFRLDGPHGQHTCLVHQPLGMSLDQYLCFFPGKVMTLEDMKPCLRQVIGTLEFLHEQARIIHTDIQLKNLLMPSADSLLPNVEQGEMEDPSPRKVVNGRTIYTSRLLIPGNGLPLISDMGECRFLDGEHSEDIMPNQYRAPEVALKMNWDCKVDIWNVAMLAWDIVNSRTLFQGRNQDDIFDDRVHLAEMVALLGPPPKEFVNGSKVGHVFWDENGDWKNLAPVPDISVESLGANIKGEDKAGFFRFLRKALRWLPEERPTAYEILRDEWLMEGLNLSRRR
ncbi:CMGC protein kinase [Penicillium hispanicum]|uniref:CMGC protein kinase n=1 Tax=Penicillium hispanicum TaxID=1080232 RepID=UPI0025422410|nr:CMGC protein kinase [Penicillium hispanicum]KAJ5587346.1 CMGC protein kinase [Penicillium hispanicum]